MRLGGEEITYRHYSPPRKELWLLQPSLRIRRWQLADVTYNLISPWFPASSLAKIAIGRRLHRHRNLCIISYTWQDARESRSFTPDFYHNNTELAKEELSMLQKQVLNFGLNSTKKRKKSELLDRSNLVCLDRLIQSVRSRYSVDVRRLSKFWL